MTFMVGLNTVIAAVLAITAALSLGASMGMRGNRPMALFGIALFMGSVQTVIMTYWGGAVEVIAAAVLAPAAYFTVGVAIALMAPRRAPNRMVAAGAASLSAVAVVLAMADTAYFLQLLAVQTACGVTVVYATLEMWRHARPDNIFDRIILAGLWFISACSLVRIPLLVFYYGFDITAEGFRSSTLETILLSLSGLLAPLLIVLLIARNVGDALAAYQRQSERDALTGLLNRRGLDALATEPSWQGGAVIFCDIDLFKSVNDRFGHQVGDGVIRSFAAILGGPGYPAGRMGGEEFAIVLDGHSLSEARDLAEMFRARCASERHAGMPPETSVTASFGVAKFAPGRPASAAFVDADRALYKAKRDGRNRVVCGLPPDHRETAARQVA